MIRRSPSVSARSGGWLALGAALLLGVPSCFARSRPVAAAPPTASTPRSSAPEDWRYQRPPAGEAAELVYPAPQHAVLPNGLNLYVVRRPAGIVSMALVVRTEPPPLGRSGLHALTVRMLTEGTIDHPGLALAEAVESLGTTLDSDAGRDSVNISLETLRQDAPRALALLAEVVQRPAFEEGVFERVRKEWIDGLVAERQDPSRLAALVGMRRLLGERHGAPVRGAAEDIRSLQIGEIHGYHAQNFVPNRSALVVVGDLAVEELRPEAERLFGGWKALPPPEQVPADLPELPGKSRVVLVDRPGAVQTALFVGQPFPKRSLPGFEARQILSSVLGGLFTSRLNQNLREKNAYTYGAGSAAVATRYWGALVASTSAKTEVSIDALTEVVTEIRSLRGGARGKPITEDELERAHADLVATLGAHLEHTSRILADTASQFVYNLPLDYFPRFAERLRAVDRQVVAAEAAKHLLPDGLIVVAVGDRSKLEGPLAQGGYHWEVAAPDLLR